MIKTLSKSDFIQEFLTSERKNSFTYDGLSALFDYLEEVNPDYDFDLVELDCDFTEYSANELKEAYAHLKLDTKDLIEYLNDQTIVIEVSDDSWIIQAF